VRRYLSLSYSFELIFAALAVTGGFATLYTFVVGRHYIIPSVLLLATVIAANLARFGFKDRIWAKEILFWTGLLFTAHAFMALFFSKRYREILSGAFEPVCAFVTIVFALLTLQYARRNRLFKQS
jgi:hypothetical protein